MSFEMLGTGGSYKTIFQNANVNFLNVKAFKTCIYLYFVNYFNSNNKKYVMMSKEPECFCVSEG